MFEVPGAKRLKRSDLLQDDSENENLNRLPDGAEVEIVPPEIGGDTSYGFEYDFIEQPNSKDIQTKSNGDENVEKESFQFNLFKPKKQTTADKHANENVADTKYYRISIRSPTPVEPGQGSFMSPRRPDSYYLTEALPIEEFNALKAQYAAVATSGTQILKQSKSTAWPGTFVPWRVINLPSNKVLDKARSKAIQTLHHHSNEATSNLRRMRPSKKRRILLRKRLAFRSQLERQNEKNEEAEREKRTKKNREKKVKRKEREKRKKQEAASAADSNKDESVSLPDIS